MAKKKRRDFPHWIEAVDSLIELQEIYDYKKGWLVHKLNCWSPPKLIWQYVDEKVKLNLPYWEKEIGELACEERDLTSNEMFKFVDVYTEIYEVYEQLRLLQQRFFELKRNFGSFDIKA